MFISHFNRYFEKHAKLTYFVLLIVIIATFVIFVTPGSMGGGQQRLKDFGTMYGKTLGVEMMQKEMAKTTLALWLQNPQFFGETFSSQGEALFQETLSRMRLLHYGKEKGLDKGITDADLQAYIQKIPLVQDEKGVFSKENFDALLKTSGSVLGIIPVVFDQVVRETIVMERVMEQVRDEVSVSGEEVDAQLARYTLQCATVAIQPQDAQPTEEEIQKYFQERRGEIRLPDSRNALVAVMRYDRMAQEMGEQAQPSEEEIAQRYETNKNTVYQGKELAEVKEEIRQALTQERVRARARTLVLELYREFQVPVQDEKLQDRVERFRAQAERQGAVVMSTGMVSLGNAIQGLGNQPRLADAIRNVGEPGGVTSMIPTDVFVAVAMVVDQQPTQMPEALPALEGAEQDALRRVVSAAILRERALAFFQEKVKTPYDTLVACQEEMEKNSSLTQAQKQQAVSAAAEKVDFALVQRFYVPEMRSFAQVTFPPVAYAGAVSAPDAAAVEAAFNARAVEFEGKTLDEVRERVEEDLRAQAARKLAEEAAQAFATALSDAWWKSQEKQGDAAAESGVAALMQEMAEKIPEAKFQVVEKLDPRTQLDASNSELVAALYKTGMSNPVSHAVFGLDDCYVLGLLAVEAPHLTDPATEADAYGILEQSYLETKRMEVALVRASEEKARLEKALAENGGDLTQAAGELAFSALPSFSLDDIVNRTAVISSVEQSKHISLQECAPELEKVTKPGVLLNPCRAEQSFSLGQGFQSVVIPVGYQLLYVADRVVPAQDGSQSDERAKVSERLLAEKQNLHAMEFFQQLQADSQTMLRPNTPYTERVEE
ncbi:MAG: hypothetical protein ACI4SG_04395 [Oligosphaeraceae bacterium]